MIVMLHPHGKNLNTQQKHEIKAKSSKYCPKVITLISFLPHSSSKNWYVCYRKHVCVCLWKHFGLWKRAGGYAECALLSSSGQTAEMLINILQYAEEPPTKKNYQPRDKPCFGAVILKPECIRIPWRIWENSDPWASPPTPPQFLIQ